MTVMEKYFYDAMPYFLSVFYYFDTIDVLCVSRVMLGMSGTAGQRQWWRSTLPKAMLPDNLGCYQCRAWLRLSSATLTRVTLMLLRISLSKCKIIYHCGFFK